MKIVLHRFLLGTLSLVVTIAFWLNSPVWAESKGNSTNIFNSALDHVRQHNYQKALIDFTQVIKQQDSLIGSAYSNRCLVNLQLQNYSAAETDCTVAVQYNSENTEAHLDLGLAYYLREKYQLAIAEYQEVIQRDRQDYRAYYNRGLAHYALQDYRQAIADYNLALMSSSLIANEQKTLIYNDRGLTHMMLKNYSQAIADTKQAIALEHHNYNAYFNQGCAHHRQGDYLAAIEDFTQVVQLNPDLTQAYINRAVLHHQLGHNHSALSDINIALQQYKKQGNHLAYAQVVNLKRKLFHSQPSQLA